MRNTGWSIIRTVWTGIIPISWRCVDSRRMRPDFHSASSGCWTHVLAPKAHHDQADLHTERRHQQPVGRSAHSRNNCNLLKWRFEVTCPCPALPLKPCPPCIKCLSAPTYLIQINGSLSDLRTSWLFAATRCSEHHPGHQEGVRISLTYLWSDEAADLKYNFNYDQPVYIYKKITKQDKMLRIYVPHLYKMSAIYSFFLKDWVLNMWGAAAQIWNSILEEFTWELKMFSR